MKGRELMHLLRDRLDAVPQFGGRVLLGERQLPADQALPTVSIIHIDGEIQRRACTTHQINDILVIEAAFKAAHGDVITPGYDAIELIQSAIRADFCDYTYGNRLIDLGFTNRRILPREDGAASAVCQLKLVARYNEDF